MRPTHSISSKAVVKQHLNAMPQRSARSAGVRQFYLQQSQSPAVGHSASCRGRSIREHAASLAPTGALLHVMLTVSAGRGYLCYESNTTQSISYAPTICAFHCCDPLCKTRVAAGFLGFTTAAVGTFLVGSGSWRLGLQSAPAERCFPA